MRIRYLSADVCSFDLLMHGIEGSPRAVEVEAARADVALLDLGENLFAVDDRSILAFPAEAADIASAARRLHRDQLINDIVGAAAHFGVARLLPCQHQRGHIMAEDRKSTRLNSSH